MFSVTPDLLSSMRTISFAPRTPMPLLYRVVSFFPYPAQCTYSHVQVCHHSVFEERVRKSASGSSPDHIPLLLLFAPAAQ